MKDTLDNLIDRYIGAKPEKEKQLVAAAVREKIIGEIKPAIEDEMYDSMKEKVQKEMEEKRNFDQAQHLKNLMLEGIVLAFIVGMTVNQFTDIISVFKPEEINSWWWLATIGISVVFIVFIILYVGLRLYTSIVNIMKNTHNT